MQWDFHHGLLDREPCDAIAELAARIQTATDELRRHTNRHLEVWVDEDGMLVVRGRLSPEVGAVVQRALEAASDRLYHDANDTAEVSVGQRRADALRLIAESALAANLDRGTAGLSIGPHTTTPDWHGERLDLNWAITVLHPATAAPWRRDVPAGTLPTSDANHLGALT